jgi:hypothetical protein
MRATEEVAVSQPIPRRDYPNVNARLRLARTGPALPPREGFMDIWLKGSRFRVRDEAGRSVAAILDDLAAPRGLGAAPRSLEAIMDVWSQSSAAGPAAPGATELYGDLATGEGWVRRRGQAAWPIAAETLAPAAEQILAGETDARLARRGSVTRLGRPGVEYQGVLEGEEQGVPYRSAVTRVVAPPYLLFIDVRDAANPDHAYTREVVALEEGAVADAHLTPP